MIELTSLFAVSAAALVTANVWQRVRAQTVRQWDVMILFTVSLVAAVLATMAFLHYTVGV